MNGQGFAVTIAMRATAVTIPAGHSLRLSVAAASFPAFPVNPGTGSTPAETTAAEETLYGVPAARRVGTILCVVARRHRPIRTNRRSDGGYGTRPPVTSGAKAIYDLDPTAMFACKADPRFHYCLYVPPAIAEGTKMDLLVAVHGTSRTSFLDFRDGFAAFGRWNNVAILCPIFPIGVRGDGPRRRRH